MSEPDEVEIEILTEPFAIPPDEKEVPVSGEELNRIAKQMDEKPKARGEDEA